MFDIAPATWHRLAYADTVSPRASYSGTRGSAGGSGLLRMMLRVAVAVLAIAIATLGRVATASTFEDFDHDGMVL